MDKTKDKKGKGNINKEEITIKHCTLIERLNSLTVPSGVAICRNLPFDESAGENPKVHLLKKKTSEVATNVYSRENVRKTKKRSASFENKGSGVVYAWGRY